LGLAQGAFQLGEHLLDPIEVGRVGRQEEELGARGSDVLADSLGFVAAEIVNDDDVAWLPAPARRRPGILSR
jgi:hypothetical protein